MAAIPIVGPLVVCAAWLLLTGGPRESAQQAPAPVDRRQVTSPDLAIPPQTVAEEGIRFASHETSAQAPRLVDRSDEPSQQPIEISEELVDRVIGEWEDDYRGKRRLIVRKDGTATMIVRPEGIGKKLFAEKLEFQIEWTHEDDRIVMITTGGEPKAKTNLVLRLYGDRAEYTILNVDDKQLLLLDADGETKFDWRRVVE